MREQKVLLPSVAGWYGPTDPGSRVHVMDGSRPRPLDPAPMLVGECLAPHEGPHGELSGKPARTLAGVFGVTYETFLCLFARKNLLKYWRAKQPPGVSALRAMSEGFAFNGCPLVFIGRRVADALEFREEFYFWAKCGTADAVVIPNLSRAKPITKKKIAQVLREALLYHGKVFRIGDYPHGDGSYVMLQGPVWGDAERRLKHRAKES